MGLGGEELSQIVGKQKQLHRCEEVPVVHGCKVARIARRVLRSLPQIQTRQLAQSICVSQALTCAGPPKAERD